MTYSLGRDLPKLFMNVLFFKIVKLQSSVSLNLDSTRVTVQSLGEYLFGNQKKRNKEEEEGRREEKGREEEKKKREQEKGGKPNPMNVATHND